ncbi:MAG: hypothetical protein CMA03_02825 [Euryarchaeota archaeon]|nr:hypothetical protein [Euryarchaeota archaeon]
MEVTESSFANVIVAFSLLSCFTLLFSSALRNLLLSRNWNNKKLKTIELFLRWLPAILFFILFIRYAIAHILLNSSHVHVAYHLNSDSSVLIRLLCLFVGYDGASIMLMFVILITHLLLIKYIKIKSTDMVDRWFSLLWIICLTGVLPEQTFEMLNAAEFAPVSEDLLIQSAKKGILASLIFGLILGFGPHAMELNISRKSTKPLLLTLGIFGMLSISIGPLDALVPLSNNIWNAKLFSELEIIRLGTIITILSLFSFGPSIVYYSEKIDTLIPVGKNRSMSLAISILIGFCCLIFLSIGFLYTEWSFVSIFYELIYELFPILFFALIFSLLPIIGLDERARPELHGWRYGLFVGMALSCINSALISLTLLHGWILALFFSLTLPLILESSIMLNSKIKFVNLVTSLFCLLFIILLMTFFSDLNVVLPTIGLCCIILMEVNDIQLSKVNQLLKT